MVVDFLKNQFQGKDIANIAKAHPELVGALISRGLPLDDDIVFGKLYPELNFACVHDTELHMELPDNVVPIRGDKDDTRGTSETASADTVAGGTEVEGRSVPGTEGTAKTGRRAKAQTKTDRPARSKAPISKDTTELN